MSGVFTDMKGGGLQHSTYCQSGPVALEAPRQLWPFRPETTLRLALEEIEVFIHPLTSDFSVFSVQEGVDLCGENK